MIPKKGSSAYPKGESNICSETIDNLELKMDSLERIFEERFDNLTERMTKQFEGCREVCVLKLDALKSRADYNQGKIKEHDVVLSEVTKEIENQSGFKKAIYWLMGVIGIILAYLEWTKS